MMSRSVPVHPWERVACGGCSTAGGASCMPECTNPLWPCAMTGAAACLAGFEGMTVVIHGSSGCYYYPTTLLRAPLHGTFILEHEIIFGSEDRLNEVIGGLSGQGKRIAVITTCVPAILG